MLRFVCPHCEQELHVPERHLGARGTCNKCGGRIALIGHADPTVPQRASLVADAPEGKSEAGPATGKQLEYLRALGAPEEELKQIDRDAASGLIERYQRDRRRTEPATEKQRDYLRRLGAPEILMVRATSKESASALIEAMFLHPTPGQVEALRRLGATGAQIAALKSRAAAEALLIELRGRSS